MNLCVVLGVLGLYLLCNSHLRCNAQSANERSTIPIGVLLNHTEREEKAAINYEISRHEQARFRLKTTIQTLNIEDAYSVIASICSHMLSGVYVMLGSHSMLTISAIKSYASTFHMPFISTSVPVNMTKQENSYEIYMNPLLAPAVFDLMKYYNWNKAYYFYNSREGLYRFQQVLEAANRGGMLLPMELRKVLSVNDILDTLDELTKIDDLDKKIIVDISNEQAEELLVQQKKDQKKRLRFHFMFVNVNINEGVLEIYRLGGINLTCFNLMDYSNQTVKRFMDNWRILSPEQRGSNTSKISVEAALAIDALTLVEKTMTKVLNRDSRFFNDVIRQGIEMDCDSEPVTPWRHGDIIIKTMKEVEFNGLTGRVAFDSHGLRRDYKLDVSEINFGEGPAKIGTWLPQKGFQRESGRLQIRYKGNETISNRTRIVTSIVTEPYLMVKPGFDANDTNRFEGFCVDLANLIKDIIKFDYIIVPVKDDNYGSQNENNTWNGMIGELINGEADLAIAPLTITSDREKVVDFSKPFMNLGISIMIAKPEKPSITLFSFMAPLSYEIWMCIAFAYIGVSVVLFLVSRFSPYEWHVEDTTEGPSVSNNFTIFNSLWFSLAAFMQQGVDVEPRSVSGRLVGSVWWFFTLIIISSYTANLAAFLTVERMQSPIESAEDLAKQTEIKYGVVSSGSTKEFFRKSTINVYERMWAAMHADKSVMVNNNSAGIAKVRAGKYAFLSESTTIDYQNQRLPCNTMKVGGNLDSKGYGIATPFGSDLRDKITLAVLELREGGQLQKLENKWWLEKGQCGTDTTSGKKESTSSLQLESVAGIFFILIAGVVLSLLMAAIEFLYKSHVEAKRRKSSFSATVYSRAKLSIKGMPDKQMTAYTYAPAAQLVTLDGYGDNNSFSQV